MRTWQMRTLRHGKFKHLENACGVLLPFHRDLQLPGTPIVGPGRNPTHLNEKLITQPHNLLLQANVGSVSFSEAGLSQQSVRYKIDNTELPG